MGDAVVPSQSGLFVTLDYYFKVGSALPPLPRVAEKAISVSRLFATFQRAFVLAASWPLDL
jgi:hypothetical protein